MLGSLFSATEFEVVSGALRAKMPNGFWAAIGLEFAFAEQLTRSFALQLLAAQYTGYNCWNRQWDNRPTFESEIAFNLGGNPSFEKTCTTGTVAIEIDGITHYFDADICNIEFVD